MILDVTMDDRRTLSKPIKILQKRLACVQPPLPSIFLRGGAAVHRLQKDPITLRLAILVEVEETQNAHNQAPSYRPM